ncbi:MAG: ribonuclease R [Lachnospiraceae bacterium]|nr:ribonuclease R [Lachnospiraceae bacterium]
MDKKLLKERKKKILDLFSDGLYVPMKIKELAIFMQVSKSERQELNEVIDELLEEGKIQISQKGKLSLKNEETLTGTFISHQNGFGFIEIEGREDDLFVSESETNGALHKDIVQVALLKGTRGKRQEAKVLKIVERGTASLVGTYEQGGKGFGFVIPDNVKIIKDIFVPVERSKGAVTGHKVVVKITDYGSEKKKPEGIITEIIGHVDDPGVDIISIVKGFDLPIEFPEKVKKQVDNVAKEVTEADIVGRMDLRNLQMVTIDGEDAKDLDDAVSLETEGEFYKLGVHIADVTNYVQENSALDREAKERGTSVYLVDRVIPMLPHELSNGICSLNEKVDRLALSCLMTINKKGIVVDSQITESVIRVNRRMSYTEVRKILLKEDEELIEECIELVPMFEQMSELAEILRKKRFKRGSIDFDFPETKIILDKEGHPIEIKPYERNIATKLIEDFMLIANETVAETVFWQEIPFVYRSHEKPDPEKIQKLGLFINNFGYSIHISQEEVHPKELQKLLRKIEGLPEEALISRLTLRSMKRAQYTVDCAGHFGLACEYYCHFTSPIRRYPDLQIHRIIKENLRGRLKENRFEHYEKILPEVAKHSSDRERLADEAERETDKLKKVEFMEKRIGEVFEGVISGVTSWGIYVELPNTVEGLVHVSNLPGDYFHYREDKYEMVGETTNRTYKLGEKVKVKVSGTDKITRTIDFVIAEADEEDEESWQQKET